MEYTEANVKVVKDYLDEIYTSHAQMREVVANTKAYHPRKAELIKRFDAVLRYLKSEQIRIDHIYKEVIDGLE